MNRLRNALALALVALWPLATSHCRLESLPGFEFIACVNSETADAPHQDNDCHSDGCESVESGGYKTEDDQVQLISSLLLTAAFTLPFPVQAQAEPPPRAAQIGSDPPALSKVWQFSSRAALPPRAPSFVS